MRCTEVDFTEGIVGGIYAISQRLPHNTAWHPAKRHLQRLCRSRAPIAKDSQRRFTIRQRQHEKDVLDLKSRPQSHPGPLPLATPTQKLIDRVAVGEPRDLDRVRVRRRLGKAV